MDDAIPEGGGIRRTRRRTGGAGDGIGTGTGSGSGTAIGSGTRSGLRTGPRTGTSSRTALGTVTLAAAVAAASAAVLTGCGSSGSGPATTPNSAALGGAGGTGALPDTTTSATTGSPAPTVTIRFDAGIQTPATLAAVETILQKRITAERLTGVTVNVSKDGTGLVVTGPAVDRDRLIALGARGLTQFRPVLASAPGAPSATPPSPPTAPAGVPAALWQKFVTLDCTKQPTPGTDPSAASAPTGEPADAALVTCSHDTLTKYVLAPTEIDGKDVQAATAALDKTSGAWQVNLTFDSTGTLQFSDVTTRLVQSGSAFAIVMDGVVYSAPTIQSPITSGQAQITGGLNQTSAGDLAAILGGGALPAALVATG